MSGCRVAGALQSRADLGRAKRAHRAVAVAGTRRQSQTVAERAVLAGARATQGRVSCISSSWRGGVFISTVSTQRLWAQVKVWGDDRVVGRGSQPSQVKRQAPPPGPRPLNCLVLSPDTPLLISHQALAVPNCYSAFLTAAPGLVLSPTHSTSAGVIAGTAHCCIHPRPPGPGRPQ
jgi:hypothetical protein